MQNPTRVDAFFYRDPDSCGVAHFQKLADLSSLQLRENSCPVWPAAFMLKQLPWHRSLDVEGDQFLQWDIAQGLCLGVLLSMQVLHWCWHLNLHTFKHSSEQGLQGKLFLHGIEISWNPEWKVSAKAFTTFTAFLSFWLHLALGRSLAECLGF